MELVHSYGWIQHCAERELLRKEGVTMTIYLLPRTKKEWERDEERGYIISPFPEEHSKNPKSSHRPLYWIKEQMENRISDYRLAEGEEEIHLLSEKYDVSKHWSRTRYEDEDEKAYVLLQVEINENRVLPYNDEALYWPLAGGYLDLEPYVENTWDERQTTLNVLPQEEIEKSWEAVFDIELMKDKTNVVKENVMYMTGRIELSEVQVIEEYTQIVETED